MPIYTSSNNIQSRHHVHFNAGDQLEYYEMTGVAIFDFLGSSNWNRDRLSFDLKIPHLPAGKVLELEHWTVFATINAIGNEGHAVDGGHAVDAFRLINPRASRTVVSVEVDIAARDKDAYLHRVGYRVSLLGRIVDEERIIIR